MECPKCNVEMQVFDPEGVNVLYCPQCGGVWRDRGRLEGGDAGTAEAEPGMQRRGRNNGRGVRSEDADDEQLSPVRDRRSRDNGDDPERRDSPGDLLRNLFDFG